MSSRRPSIPIPMSLIWRCRASSAPAERRITSASPRSRRSPTQGCAFAGRCPWQLGVICEKETPAVARDALGQGHPLSSAAERAQRAREHGTGAAAAPAASGIPPLEAARPLPPDHTLMRRDEGLQDRLRGSIFPAHFIPLVPRQGTRGGCLHLVRRRPSCAPGRKQISKARRAC